MHKGVAPCPGVLPQRRYVFETRPECVQKGFFNCVPVWYCAIPHSLGPEHGVYATRKWGIGNLRFLAALTSSHVAYGLRSTQAIISLFLGVRFFLLHGLSRSYFSALFAPLCLRSNLLVTYPIPLLPQ